MITQIWLSCCIRKPILKTSREYSRPSLNFFLPWLVLEFPKVPLARVIVLSCYLLSIFIMGVLKPLLYNSNMCPIDVGFCCLFSIKLKLSCFLVYLMIFYCILDIIIIMLWDCFIVKFFVSTGSSVTALVRKGGYHLGTAQLGWKFRFPT